jgi:hypothetical protein
MAHLIYYIKSKILLNIYINYKMPNDDYDYNNFLGFAVVGIIIKLFFGNSYTDDGSSGPASSTIWGYGLIIASVLMIIFLKSISDTNTPDLSDIKMEYTSILGMFGKTFEYLKYISPLLIMFVILAWIVVLNNRFFTSINKGLVSQEFFSYSFLSTLLVFLQLMVIYKWLFANDDAKKGEKSKLATITYLFTVLNIMLTGMMQIVLEYFSTDG